MLAFSKAKWTAVTGYAFAAAGIIIFTQLDRIVDLRLGARVLNVAAVGTMAAIFGGFVAAAVGSVIWARRTVTRQPLKLAALVGAGSLLLSLIVGVNVHGPSAILMFLVLFSVINVLTLLVVSYW